HLFDYSSTKTSKGGDRSFYTSLISDDRYTSPPDSTYFSGILQKENSHVTCSDSTEGFNTLGHSIQDVMGFESRGLFSSDSGIEMTPAESTDVNKTLADPMKVEAYKYMDISRSEEVKYQERCNTSLEDKNTSFIDKCPETAAKLEHISGSKKPAFEETKVAKGQNFSEESTVPSYAEEIFGDQHSASLITAPVKITLTETESVGEPANKELPPNKQETGLKPSHEVVPTVTVSEPEDDSPGSLTPPSSGTASEESPKREQDSPLMKPKIMDIIQEEREAELNSELIIESCDASSASEESPKREQDSPLMKPIIMDIIQEESGSRPDASDFEVSKTTESRMNRENLAESASYLKCSFVAPKVSVEPPTSATSTEELKEKIIQKKPLEATVVNQSKLPSKDSGKRSPLASPSLPFLNKQKEQIDEDGCQLRKILACSISDFNISGKTEQQAGLDLKLA
ncbi:Reticulon-1, partial [Chelonia mydas]